MVRLYRRYTLCIMAIMYPYPDTAILDASVQTLLMDIGYLIDYNQIIYAILLITNIRDRLEEIDALSDENRKLIELALEDLVQC